MTALKPIENRRVQGVTSFRYPPNETCSMPDCWEPSDDPHHIFPRSLLGNDSWFVSIEFQQNGQWFSSPAIPHVVGLCRPHHEDVEQHRSWIKLLDDQFLWFDRYRDESGAETWELIGALDPQPAKGEKGKKPVRRLYGDDRRKRKRISIALPDDWEDGGALWDELVADVKEWCYEEGLFSDPGRIPVAEALFGMWHDWKQVRRHTPQEEDHEPEEATTLD